MKELIEFIVKNLVEKPDEVLVTVENHGSELVVRVVVAESDIGKVIGRSGKVANAIRTVARTCATKQNKHVSIKFTENK